MEIFDKPWRLVQNRIRGAGGREIDRFRGVYPPIDDETGSEAWIGSVTRVGGPPADKPDYGCSETILPDGRGMFLYEAIALSPEKTLGLKHMKINGDGLGMLVKYLDAKEKYWLQCHPSREWAKKMWNSPYGKEECWYCIGVREDTESGEPPYILLGFKEGVTIDDWKKYYYVSDIGSLENLCHKIYIKPGEAYFVGAGCPHALGEGCFVVEVQEPSDLTLSAMQYSEIVKHWRGVSNLTEDFYNERLLGAYCYEGLSYEDNLLKRKAARKTIRSGGWGAEETVIGADHTTFFSLTEAFVNSETEIRGTGFPQIAVVLDGRGEIKTGDYSIEIKKADEIFLPYGLGAKISGENLRIVYCHPEGAMNY